MPANQEPSSAFPAGMVVYHIYCRSFQDTNNDGIGDIGGILSKIDYLADLGVTTLWISPMYPSPQIDFGYDISDFCDVDPALGTLEEFDQLIHEAHRRNIRIITDLVINHTSDQHTWFQESRRSRRNPRRDWYVWQNPHKDGSPPNNWLSVFGGSAWEFDGATRQYYLHAFAKEQPDLNWRNPEVRSAIKNVMRFWLDRGVDGFRVDAANWLAEDPDLRDDLVSPSSQLSTINPYSAWTHSHSRFKQETYIYLDELTSLLSEYQNRFMIVESQPDVPIDIPSYIDFYTKVNPLVAAPFNFSVMHLPWKAPFFKQFIDEFQTALEPNFVPVYVYGNHDNPRLATRIGPDATPAAALLQLTLPGTAVIYYGEEIGMKNVDIPPDKVQDIFEKNLPGGREGRDAERTPMQWSSQEHAGFSTVEPWLPIAGDYRTKNVEQEAANEHSLLNTYKKLLAFRAKSNAIQHGTYQPLKLNHSELFGFVRQTSQEKLAIVINFSKNTIPLDLAGQTLLTTHPNAHDQTNLQPLEGRILAIQ